MSNVHQTRPPSSALDPDGPLLLVAPEVRHAPAIVRALHASMPALRAFMPFAHLEQTADTQYARLVGVCADYWRGEDYNFHLVDPSEPDAFVGCVGLHRRALHRDALEVGYWIRSDRAGQGLGTRAAQLATWLAVAHFGCVRVQCVFDPANRASARVAEKVGFQDEGLLRGFSGSGDATMRAAGWLGSGDDQMTAMSAAQARAQPWWAPLAARAEVRDWRGELVG